MIPSSRVTLGAAVDLDFKRFYLTGVQHGRATFRGMRLQPNPWMMLPFALLLGAIALAPLLAPHWWLRHYAKIALGLGTITLAISFLFCVTRPAWRTPRTNTSASSRWSAALRRFRWHPHRRQRRGHAVQERGFFVHRRGFANLLGTTGAAMLLIRPWIRMNRYRVTAHHIVFFIFIVANVCGCLTPIGDPPLFFGFLQGIPFWWVAEHCWPMWGVALPVARHLLRRGQYQLFRAPVAVWK